MSDWLMALNCVLLFFGVVVFFCLSRHFFVAQSTTLAWATTTPSFSLTSARRCVNGRRRGAKGHSTDVPFVSLFFVFSPLVNCGNVNVLCVCVQISLSLSRPLSLSLDLSLSLSTSLCAARGSACPHQHCVCEPDDAHRPARHAGEVQNPLPMVDGVLACASCFVCVCVSVCLPICLCVCVSVCLCLCL